MLLTTLGMKATVLSKPDHKGEVAVQAGAIKTKAHLSQLRMAKPEVPEKKKKAVASGKVSMSMRPVETECDVRGMNLEEALHCVDMFLDGAIINKLKVVTVIHGKGTGILRAGVHKHLKQNPAVQEFRLGRYGEGEDGVTIVTLK